MTRLATGSVCTQNGLSSASGQTPCVHPMVLVHNRGSVWRHLRWKTRGTSEGSPSPDQKYVVEVQF